VLSYIDIRRGRTVAAGMPLGQGSVTEVVGKVGWAVCIVGMPDCRLGEEEGGWDLTTTKAVLCY
jgi:hypothetical protein